MLLFQESCITYSNINSEKKSSQQELNNIPAIKKDRNSERQHLHRVSFPDEFDLIVGKIFFRVKQARIIEQEQEESNDHHQPAVLKNSVSFDKIKIHIFVFSSIQNQRILFCPTILPQKLLERNVHFKYTVFISWVPKRLNNILDYYYGTDGVLF